MKNLIDVYLDVGCSRGIMFWIFYFFLTGWNLGIICMIIGIFQSVKDESDN